MRYIIIIIIIIIILILFTSGGETSDLPHHGIQTTAFLDKGERG